MQESLCVINKESNSFLLFVFEYHLSAVFCSDERDLGCVFVALPSQHSFDMFVRFLLKACRVGPSFFPGSARQVHHWEWLECVFDME